MKPETSRSYLMKIKNLKMICLYQQQQKMYWIQYDFAIRKPMADQSCSLGQNIRDREETLT